MKNNVQNVSTLKGRLFKVTLILLSVTCLVGLNTALSLAGHAGGAPLAIDYLASKRSHTAVMEVNDKAEMVWQNMVSLAKKRNPGSLAVEEENRKDLVFEAEKTYEDGQILWGHIKVRPLGESSSLLIFTATMKGGKQLEVKMKDFVMDTIMQYCDETGVTCKVTK